MIKIVTHPARVLRVVVPRIEPIQGFWKEYDDFVGCGGQSDAMLHKLCRSALEFLLDFLATATRFRIWGVAPTRQAARKLPKLRY
jgi:hypothetical protein